MRPLWPALRLIALGAGFTVLLASEGCSGPTGNDSPTTEADAQAPTSIAATPLAASSPNRASPTAQTGGAHLTASVTVTNKNRYTYTIAFSVATDGALSVNTTDAKPGQAKVSWTPVLDGVLTVTNTTAGHTLPIPDWLYTSCAANAGHCLSLFSFWPADSPVCTVKIEDPTGHKAYANIGKRNEYNQIFVYPAGQWCMVRYGSAGSLDSSNQTMPIAGSASTNWKAGQLSAVLQDANDASKLATALAAGPKIWLIASPTWAGETTQYSITGCVPAALTVFWSSAPVTCMHLN
jgi:hypothetical protein